MLVRERDSIISAISTPWQRISTEMQKAHEESKEKALAAYKKDSRVVGLSEALDEAGVANSDDVAMGIVSGVVTGGMYGVGPKITHRPSRSVYSDMLTTTKSLAAPGFINLLADPCYAELNIALTTSTMKWSALQTHVYLLMADLNSATTYDDLRAAIRTFTKSIA